MRVVISIASSAVHHQPCVDFLLYSTIRQTYHSRTTFLVLGVVRRPSDPLAPVPFAAAPDTIDDVVDEPPPFPIDLERRRPSDRLLPPPPPPPFKTLGGGGGNNGGDDPLDTVADASPTPVDDVGTPTVIVVSHGS